MTTKTKATEPAEGDGSMGDSRGHDADPLACVVDDGTPHVGRATHGGRVCSAHAMHYRSDGTRRGE